MLVKIAIIKTEDIYEIDGILFRQGSANYTPWTRSANSLFFTWQPMKIGESITQQIDKSANIIEKKKKPGKK